MSLLTPSDKPTLHLVLPDSSRSNDGNPQFTTMHIIHSSWSKSYYQSYQIWAWEWSACSEGEWYSSQALYGCHLSLSICSHITSPEQLKKYIATAKEYNIAFSTSHQHDVIRTKDGEKRMDFPDFDNIISLLHNQSRMPLWNTGKRGENQSTTHLVNLLKPSSTKFELEGSKNISLVYYLPYEQFVYRKKSISFTEAIDVLVNLREEIVTFEWEGIVEEGSVEEIQIPLQPVGKQANSAKLTVKQKKAMKGQ